MAVRKCKVSLSLPIYLVEWVDGQANGRSKRTRSGIVEAALRVYSKRAAAQEIEDATVAYYRSLDKADVTDDAEWAGLGDATFGNTSR